MAEPLSFKDKLRLAFIEKDLSGRGWARLALLVVSLAAAKTVFRLTLTAVVVAGVVYWVNNWYQAERLDLAETNRRAAEARQMAEETKRIVDEAHDRATAVQEDTRIRQMEVRVQHGVQTTILALIGYQTDKGYLTARVDDLHDYGWRRDPNLIYDLQLLRNADGDPSFIVTVAHRQKGPRAYRYDPDSGLGLEPTTVGVTPDRGSLAETWSADNEPGVEPETEPLVDTRPITEEVRKQNELSGQEFAVKAALQRIALAQSAYQADHGVYASRYEDLHPYGWRANPDCVFGEILVGQTLDGQPRYRVTVRHREKGPRTFQYASDGDGVEAVD